jgi:hypothetical protein
LAFIDHLHDVQIGRQRTPGVRLVSRRPFSAASHSTISRVPSRADSKGAWHVHRQIQHGSRDEIVLSSLPPC